MASTNDHFPGRRRYRTPGVYLEEVLPEERPREFRTGIPVFVGVVLAVNEEGRVQEYCVQGKAQVCRFTRWEQFQQCFEYNTPGGFLAYAVRGFFENGGQRCVVVPLSRGDNDGLPKVLEALFRERGLLEDVEDVDLVCVPDLMMERLRKSGNEFVRLQEYILEYCKRMGDRIAILDAPPAADGKQALRRQLDAVGRWPESVRISAALYYPWLQVKSFAHTTLKGQSQRRLDSGFTFVPPCGHIAGVYARTDDRVGVHSPPANEVAEGVLDLEVDITDAEQAELNEVGVNCLRVFPRRGIRVWGARTLSGNQDWRYVNVRRLFLTLTRWLEHNFYDLIFEPNEPSLWARVGQRIGSYCYGLFQSGALRGLSPSDAFFIKCDAETNPLEVREAGQVVSEIGLAPLVPAEFIIVRVTHSVTGTTVTSPIGF